jgi:hypothetical protein
MAANRTIELIRGDTYKETFQYLVANVPTVKTTSITSVITAPTEINGILYSPIDLTGSTIKAQVRKSPSKRAKLVVSFDVINANLAIGAFDLSLTSNNSALVGADDTESYVYDCQITTPGSPDDNVETIFYGDINVLLDVTTQP